jgi:GPI mannosyltransferase 1 subunit M
MRLTVLCILIETLKVIVLLLALTCLCGDSHVFSDAAAYIQQGESPYRRATYRYTPFLAALLAALPSKQAGRYLFCIADTLCGWIILLYRRHHRLGRISSSRTSSSSNPNTDAEWELVRLQDAAWWLYNPLAINICTRGSAESLVVLLPVLCTLWLATMSSPTSASLPKRMPGRRHAWRRYGAAMASGVCHGVAIHAKLYPVIYTLSFMTTWAKHGPNYQTVSWPPETSGVIPFANRARWLLDIGLAWIRRLLSPAPIMFVLMAGTTFAGLTYAAVVWYGPDAWQQGLWYHFSRVDHRHNYSMHWYWIYLARDRAHQHGMALAGRLLLVPQLILLAYSSLGIAPHNLALALFVQTFLFVAHNKVITAQYFTWYLCLLPLCSDCMRLTRRVRVALVLLGSSIVVWLAAAYCLEIQGMAMHSTVWMASLLFFVANVNLLGALLASTKPIVQTDETRKTKKE